MCPICIANMALVIAGTTSTGGLSAFVLMKLRTRRSTNKPADSQSPSDEVQK